MMKVDQFCRTAEDIARNYKTQYKLGGVGEHNGDLWYFDCVGLPKAIIWGWCGDLNYSRGGVVFPASGQEVNGLPDVGANKMFEDYCYDKSTDFTKIEKGELVWMDGHIGIYIGNGKVAEATSAWDNKVLISDVGNKGQRTYNGRQVYSWTHHGKFKCVDYSISRKYKVGDKVILNGYYHTSTTAGIGESGYLENYKGTITKVEKSNCDYPYRIDEIGWCKESYLTPDTTPIYKYKVGQQVILNGYYHKSNEANSECLGELYNQITKIVEIKDGEYPYHLENLGWCREKYLSTYTGKDYETLYKQEALKTKDLEKQVDQLKKDKENLQAKIDKAIKSLK